MRCVKCGHESTLQFQNLSTCNSCFVKIIEKRVRKEIRLGHLIRKEERILLIDDNSAESKVSQVILKSTLSGLPFVLESIKKDYALGQDIEGDFDKVIIPWCTDYEDEYFLSTVMDGADSRFLGHFSLKKQYIKLLLPLLHEEVVAYARIKGIKFEESRKGSNISAMLDRLQQEYPETKFSLLKSSEEIGKNI